MASKYAQSCLLAIYFLASMTIPLYDYQSKTVTLLREKNAQGKKRIVIVLPTGSGKTNIAAHIIRSAKDKSKKVIFLAHRQELVYQAHERLAQFGVDAGIIMAGHPVADHEINVASVQTLVRRQRPPADIIFVDEAHHISSQSYKQILSNYPDAYVFGLTATPYRSDGKPLGEIFQDIIAPISIQELIDQGFLVRPRYFGARQDFSDVKIKMGDYDNKQLFEKVDKKILYDGVVEKFKQFGHGKTLVFCVNVQHSVKTCETFTTAGYAAAQLDAETDTPTRKRILKEFAEGKWQILCNVALLTEGFDLPAINTIILNRATKSKGLYFQICGRGIRTSEGKDTCIIIDHGSNVYEHGVVEAEQEYDIHAKKKKKKGNTAVVDQVKQCPKCQSLLGKRTQTCYYCGFNFPTFYEVVETEFEEIKIKKIVIPSHLRKPWSRMSDSELEEYRLLKGYKRGWCHYQRKLRIEGKKESYIPECCSCHISAPCSYCINKSVSTEDENNEMRDAVATLEQPADTLAELMDFFNGKGMEVN